MNGVLKPCKSRGRQELEAPQRKLGKNADIGTDGQAEEMVFALADEWVLNRIKANRTEQGFRLRLIAELESAFREVQSWPMYARREGNHNAAEAYRRVLFRLIAWRDYISRFQYAGVAGQGLLPQRPSWLPY
jgi:hypothetical protein